MAKLRISNESGASKEIDLPYFGKRQTQEGISYYAFLSENSRENINLVFDRDGFAGLFNYSNIKHALEVEEIEATDFIEAYALVNNHVIDTMHWFLTPQIEVVTDSIHEGLKEWSHSEKEPCATSAE